MRLNELEMKIRAVEGRAGVVRSRGSRGAGAAADRPVGTGWHAIDHAFPGAALPGAVVHEWFTAGEVPLAILSHLAGACRRAATAGSLAVWIGRRCWPYPRRLPAALREHSLFVDPARNADRLWAIELCARSPAVAAVVADGRGLDMTATRRLQLAANAGRALVMLARPEEDLRELSAAAVRWRVTTAPSPTNQPRWSVELLRCKGLRPASDDEGPRQWTLEGRSDEAGIVLVPPDVADRSTAAAPRESGSKVA